MKYTITVKDQKFDIEVGSVQQGMARVKVNGRDYDVRVEAMPDAAAPSVSAKPAHPSAPTPARPQAAAAPQPTAPRKPTDTGGNVIKAPIPGLILEVKVKTGDPVTPGQTVIIMEAMKMENRITATVSGTVKEIHVQKGSEVMTGTPLLELA